MNSKGSGRHSHTVKMAPSGFGMPLRIRFWEESFDLPAHFKYTSAVLGTKMIVAWSMLPGIKHHAPILSYVETLPS